MESQLAPMPKEYSEDTARLIDDEVRNLIESRFQLAADIVKEKSAALEEAATVLLKKEVITGAELQEILKERGLQLPETAKDEGRE